MTTPSTQALSDDLIAELTAAFSQAIPFLPKAFSRVVAKAFSGSTVLLYKYGGFVALQMFTRYATYDETEINGKKIRPLLELGNRLGVTPPQAATQAELVVNVTVKTQTGTITPGRQIVRTQTGVIYLVVFERALDAAVVPITIRASLDQAGGNGSGAIGNLVAGDKLEFASPLANVEREVTVVSQSVTGADAEDIETGYRPRVIAREKAPPQGGAYADYRDWASEVPGIVGVFPYAGDPGEVDVYVEASVASSGSADGYPTTPQKDAVFAAIQLNEAGLATRRPVGAGINVLSITRVSFNVALGGLAPDTAATRAEILAGVTEYFLSREPYIEGLSSLPREDRITEAALSGIVDGIVNAAGATITIVSISPGPAYTLQPGEKAKVGTLTYS